MHTDEPREIQGVELGYDPRDIDAKGIYKVVIYFFAFALVFFGLGAIVYIHYGFGIQAGRNMNRPPIAGPKLQSNVAVQTDIMTLRQTERAQMESYGTNPDGKQRIPVDAAMAIVAREGLPNVKSDERATSPGNTITQNAVGPAAPSTTTSPAQQGGVPTPDFGQGAQGTTAGATTP